MRGEAKVCLKQENGIVGFREKDRSAISSPAVNHSLQDVVSLDIASTELCGGK